MNRLLASAIGFYNVFLAIIIIVVVGFWATASLHYMGLNGLLALLVGIVGGIFSAIAVCGTLALLVEIHRELTKIRTSFEAAERP
jgi:hypothetical protein